MTQQPATESAIGESRGGDLSIVDCDVHPYMRDENDLIPYLPEHLHSQGVFYPKGYWSSPIGVPREDARPDDGGPPGSDPEKVKEQLLDQFGIDYAILTGGGPNLAASVIPNSYYAGELAAAYNDWLIDEWLSTDDRFLGCISVATQNPERGAEEIRRLADHPQMVQVIAGSATRIPLGQRNYWPLYEAAEEVGLPFAIHVGPEGRGITNPPSGAGYPNSYFERHCVLPANFMGQLISMVLEGVFVEFPDLRFVMIEGGFGWVPHTMWRLDKNWKGLKEQTPWLEEPPSHYIRRNVRFTTQPIEEPERPEQLLQLFEMMHAEETVMFASDYPHWDGDSPAHGLPNLPEDLSEAIYHRTAQKLYGL